LTQPRAYPRRVDTDNRRMKTFVTKLHLRGPSMLRMKTRTIRFTRNVGEANKENDSYAIELGAQRLFTAG